MKPHMGASSSPAKAPRRQQIRINTDQVPDSLRSALQAAEVQEIAHALLETIQENPLELPRATPVACPGAPYSRRKNRR